MGIPWRHQAEPVRGELLRRALLAFLLSPGPPHNASLRLVGGGSRCDGRVEIFRRGTWGRVLDDQWDMEDAGVVCRQLRCEEAEAAYAVPRAERGTGPVGLRGVRCAGHEAGLSLCNASPPEATGIMEDVGAVCRGEQRVLWMRGGAGSRPLTAGASPRCREPPGPAGGRGWAMCRESGDLLPGAVGHGLRRCLGHGRRRRGLPPAELRMGRGGGRLGSLWGGLWAHLAGWRELLWGRICSLELLC